LADIGRGGAGAGALQQLVLAGAALVRIRQGRLLIAGLEDGLMRLVDRRDIGGRRRARPRRPQRVIRRNGERRVRDDGEFVRYDFLGAEGAAEAFAAAERRRDEG
jgi:hypothetical protein